MQFCEEDLQKLIAEFYKKRFENQGEINNHEKWEDNDPYIDHGYNGINPRKGVQQDKGRNEPLVDSGNLKKQLITTKNWDLQPKINKNTLKLTIPKKENFTDKKYDILETKHKGGDYVSKRGNYIRPLDIPARKFKDITDFDVDTIVNNLVNDLKKKYS